MITHPRPGTQQTIDLYVRSFLEDCSVLVVGPAYVDAVLDQPAFAGWAVTDCASAFERAAPTTSTARHTDELILGTSGTTGDPKMVRFAKTAIRGCARAIAATLELNPERQYVSLANPRFAYGLSILHSHVLAGVPVHFQPVPTSLADWTTFRASLAPNSSVYLAPHQSFMLAQDPSWRLDGPVELILAGAPVRQEMVAVLASTFPSAVLVVMYGQTELGPRICTRRVPVAQFEEGNVGPPLPGVRVRTAGDTGRLEVDSPFRMTSYVDLTGAPVDSANPATAPWWATGDVGVVAASGDVHVVNRTAADVNFLGTRMRLDDLRHSALTVPRVLDVRASAVAHETYGQRPSLRVLVQSSDETAGPLEREVRKALATSIGSAASAVLIEIVDLHSLPESGKL